MNNYREVKRKHEAAVVDSFVDWLNRTSGSNWTVTDRPDPPDAIIIDGNTTSWIEHADLYRNWEEARSETSYITRSKKHIPHSEEPIHDPDRRTAMALMALLQDKLSSSSHQSSHDRFGEGLLVISERDSLFDRATIEEINRITEEMEIAGDNGYFRKIYLAIRSPQSMVYGEVTYRKG